MFDISEMAFPVCEEKFLTLKTKLPLWRQEKIDRCAAWEDKCRSLGAGLVFLYGIREGGLKAENAEIRIGEHGKPGLAAGGGKLFFNLSHSGTLAAGIFSDREAGIDIQKIVPLKETIAERERYFLPEEVCYIGGDEERFCRIWVSKESYLKAIGAGLTRPLNSFCAVPGRILAQGERKYFLRTWKLQGYMLGVCTEGKEFEGKIETLTFGDIESML